MYLVCTKLVGTAGIMAWSMHAWMERQEKQTRHQEQTKQQERSGQTHLVSTNSLADVCSKLAGTVGIMAWSMQAWTARGEKAMRQQRHLRQKQTKEQTHLGQQARLGQAGDQMLRMPCL